jgi:hypothetical protein
MISYWAVQVLVWALLVMVWALLVMVWALLVMVWALPVMVWALLVLVWVGSNRHCSTHPLYKRYSGCSTNYDNPKHPCSSQCGWHAPYTANLRRNSGLWAAG